MKRRSINRDIPKRTRILMGYGIPREDVKVWEYLATTGACQICGKQASECRGGKLAIDHKHGPSPHPRGVLCMKCNIAIGLLTDNPWAASAAADYLKMSASWLVTAQSGALSDNRASARSANYSDARRIYQKIAHESRVRLSRGYLSMAIRAKQGHTCKIEPTQRVEIFREDGEWKAKVF
jgi:hypothetical protein